jgi:hypothetical protein
MISDSWLNDLFPSDDELPPRPKPADIPQHRLDRSLKDPADNEHSCRHWSRQANDRLYP